MPPICWKVGLVLITGAGIGLAGGQAVIAGITPPTIVTPSYPVEATPIDIPADVATYPAADSTQPDYQKIADDCDNCSDFDLGYRFAAARKLSSTADCMDYSWSYQRGCLAYLRQG